MTIESSLSEIEAIVRDVLNNPNISLMPATKATDVRGWDSLSQTMILLRIEEQFGFEIPIEDSLLLANVGELAALLVKLHRQQ
ncbi:acyl carrier protein [Nibricoccus sp. IMCC34717]|uniref:acyl carrier protein n=1 Tax=Nibricoccus sp. IMCC34717 TaxID=3034021 RepID=UPI00384C107E